LRKSENCRRFIAGSFLLLASIEAAGVVAGRIQREFQRIFHIVT
jgi:hypothetical protein